MADVNVRDLRNHGGVILDRAEAGEQITITRSGRPVAQLSALPRRGVDAATLLERWRHLPRIDPVAMRRDLDELIDPSL